MCLFSWLIRSMAVNPHCGSAGPVDIRGSGVGQFDYTKKSGAETVSLSTGKFVSGSPSVGAELRAARERLGWDLPSVARSLRIRLDYLEAIEQDSLGSLPAAAYALGFVRCYAAKLGLPTEPLCRRFRAEVGSASLAPEVTFPEPLRERGMSLGGAALIAVAIAIGGYAGWYKLTENRPGEVASVPPVPERLAPLAEPAQPAPPPAAIANNTQAPAAASDDSAAPAQTADDSQTVTPSEAAATSVSNPVSNYEQVAGNASTSRVMLHANADSWLQVHDGSGNLLFSRILKAGDSWQVPANAGTLYLTTGNAGGTDVLVDGKPTAPLGGLGMVRHDLTLDPDQVKAGKLAVPAAAPTAAVVSTQPG